MNITNSETLKIVNAVNYCTSCELAGCEYLDNSIVFAYGELPVMTFAHCPVKNNTKCDCKDCLYRDFTYKSEYSSFRIRREKLSKCIFTMHNCKVHNLLNVKDFIKYCDLSDCADPEMIIESALNNKLIAVKNQTKGNFDKKKLL